MDSEDKAMTPKDPDREWLDLDKVLAKVPLVLKVAFPEYLVSIVYVFTFLRYQTFLMGALFLAHLPVYKPSRQKIDWRATVDQIVELLQEGMPSFRKFNNCECLVKKLENMKSLKRKSHTKVRFFEKVQVTTFESGKAPSWIKRLHSVSNRSSRFAKAPKISPSNQDFPNVQTPTADPHKISTELHEIFTISRLCKDEDGKFENMLSRFLSLHNQMSQYLSQTTNTDVAVYTTKLRSIRIQISEAHSVAVAVFVHFLQEQDWTEIMKKFFEIKHYQMQLASDLGELNKSFEQDIRTVSRSLFHARKTRFDLSSMYFQFYDSLCGPFGLEEEEVSEAVNKCSYDRISQFLDNFKCKKFKRTSRCYLETLQIAQEKLNQLVLLLEILCLQNAV